MKNRVHFLLIANIKYACNRKDDESDNFQTKSDRNKENLQIQMQMN